MIAKGILAAALLLPAFAFAQDRELREVRVDTSALDLSTPAGVEELRRRIHHAVTDICGGDRDCRDQAWASTDEQVDYAIARDRWSRRLAAERAQQLAACGGQDCYAPQPAYYAPQPAYYAPPPMPRPLAPAGVTVTIVYASPGAPPPQVYYTPAPRP